MRMPVRATILLLYLSQLVFACGTERWDVKTLKDATAVQILRSPKTTTIPVLVKLSHPTVQQLHANESSRIGPVERTTFILKALLLGYHSEADQDFHLVIANPNNISQTMIAEIPAPNCVTIPQFAAALQMMRTQLAQAFGAPGPKTRRLTQPVPIVLRGVGFFDFPHNQDGLAPNAIELHPVLGMRIAGQ